MVQQEIVHLREGHKALQGKPVLTGINLSLKVGERVVLLGPSGCGKSTFLRCLNGLIALDKGDLLVNSLRLSPGFSQLPPKLLQRHRAEVGLVFQQFNLFPHLTILQNLTLAPVRVLRQSVAQATEMAHQLLAQVGLPDKAQAYPHQLSGGQQQRVAIARSLAMNPRLLMLDEPTSALDPSMSQEVWRVLQALTDITLLVVTHDVHAFAETADRFVLMNAGQVVETGPPAQLLRDPVHPFTRQFFHFAS
jgi:ABC-type polar amino acid transport system ATPase subunit